jgi:hypothetical protein
MKDALVETQDAIEKNKPRYIIITSDEKYTSFIPDSYIYKLTIEDSEIYERIL